MKKTVLVVTILVLVLSLSFAMFACEKEAPPIMEDETIDMEFDEEIKVQDAKMTKGTDVRIMSYNVEVNAWGGKDREKPKERARRFEQTLCYYAPDVVALQEVCESWHNNITKTTKKYYTIMFNDPFDYTTMAYNKSKVELIEKGKIKYSKHHEKVIQMMRVIAYGVFKDKATGKTFIVTSTHLDFHPHEETMNIQIDELAKFVKEKSAEFDNCPIFAAGDYNVQEQVTKDPANCNDIYLTIAPKTGLIDANYIEGIEKVDGEKAKWNDAKWDHIFVSDASMIKKYGIASAEYYTKISDHYPIYVDATLK